MSAGFTAIHRVANSSALSDTPVAPRRISIVIPALNEAPALAALLPPRLPDEVSEVILADGGSVDDTCTFAMQRGWRVVRAPRGRAAQMNAGAAIASGDVLLFLHADTRLPGDFAQQIASVIERPGVVAGAFRLRIDSSGLALRVIEKLANLRSLILQMPFGDQAIFVPTATFRAAGGYAEIPIMEDVELIRRLRRGLVPNPNRRGVPGQRGRGRIALASSSVLTSARRWQRLGVLRATLLNQCCQWAYRCGVSPARIHRWYYGSRS